MRLLKIAHGNFAEMTYFSPRTIVTREGHTYPHPHKVWDLSTDGEPSPLSEEQAVIAKFVFRPGGAAFLRRNGFWPEGELPDATQTETVRQQLTFEAVRGLPVGGVGRVFAFAPDGENHLLARSGIIDGRERINFHLRDPADKPHPLYVGEAMVKASGEFSPSGRLAAMSCGTKVIGVWDVQELREVMAFEANNGVNDLAFVSEERLVAVAGRSVGLWNATTGRLIKKSRAFPRTAEALAVSPDRTRILAGDGDGTIRVWDTTMRELAEYDWGLNIVKAVAFSPDGSTAAASSYVAVAVWDVD